jgi:hypothetical protein
MQLNLMAATDDSTHAPAATEIRNIDQIYMSYLLYDRYRKLEIERYIIMVWLHLEGNKSEPIMVLYCMV